MVVSQTLECWNAKLYLENMVYGRLYVSLLSSSCRATNIFVDSHYCFMAKTM